jgi:hypothetical protein
VKVVATADSAADSGETGSPACAVGKAASAAEVDRRAEAATLAATGDWAMAGVEAEEVRKAGRVAVWGLGVGERAGSLHRR